MKRYNYCPLCSTTLDEKNIEGRRRKYCFECGWIDYRNPIPAVACILKEKDKILLVKRAVEPQKGRWSLPAGFMELKEGPGEAMLRELKEETGLNGKIDELIGVYSQPSPQYGTVLTVGFAVKSTGGKLSAGDDVSDAEFKKIESVDDIPFESHRRMLKDAGFQEESNGV